MQDGNVYFLVKWGGQTYDLSTWESQEDVEKVRSLEYY
jgi:hypothetical protein